MSHFRSRALLLKLIFFAMSALITATATAAVNEQSFRLGMTVQKDTPMGATAQRFKEHLAELSDGKFNLEILSGGLLGDATSLQEQISRGVLDFSIAFVSTGMDDRLGLVNVPGMYWKWQDAKAFWDEQGDMLSIFRDVAKDNQIKVLGVIPCCFNRVLTNENLTPIPTKVGELGLKSRSMSMPSDVHAVEAIGLNPVPMPLNETPSALATGMIDAVAGPAMADIPMYEGLASKVYLYRYRVEIEPLFMSLDVWNSLSEKEQQIVQKAANEATASGWEKSKAMMEDYKARSDEWGIEVIELSDDQHIENVKAIRNEVWPQVEDSIGADIMKQLRSSAVAVPGE